MIEGIVNRIKEFGNWEVSIRPTEFQERRIATHHEGFEIIEKCKVVLRGWDYPHLDHKNRSRGEGFIESWCDFAGELEAWRYFLSGQFVHRFAMGEDTGALQPRTEMLERLGRREGRNLLGITTTLYSLTEIWEFALRLGSRGVLGEQFEAEVVLHGTEGRQLAPTEFNRILVESYVCTQQHVRVSGEFITTEALARGHDVSLEWAIHVFGLFNWDDPPEQSLREDQRKLIERRF